GWKEELHSPARWTSPATAAIRNGAPASRDVANFGQLFAEGCFDGVFKMPDGDFGGLGFVIHRAAVNQLSFVVEDKEFRGVDGTTGGRQLLGFVGDIGKCETLLLRPFLHFLERF
ncbi:MAG: hypothetical protein ACK56I_32590, partial [bacterium]